MQTWLKNNYQFFILVLLCIIFVALKAPTLKIPFYWDEAWVYAPAIKAMAQNGISLLPHALSDSYSRGHPLLFFCTGALWIKLFGSSLFSMHLFALTITIVFTFTLFYIVKKVFDPSLALIIAAATLAEPIIIAQSAITLPEIFLTLWAILTIYHFALNNKFYYFLFGTLMLLTKESGIAVIAALLIYQFICFATQKVTIQSLKLFSKDSLLAATPLISFAVFLLIQHYQRGYYLFPEHLSRLTFGWDVIRDKLFESYDLTFKQQGRKFLTWSFIVLFGVLYKQIPWRARLVILLFMLAFRFVPFPSWLIMPVIGLFIGVFYYFVHIKYVSNFKTAERFLATVFISGVVYILFCSFNFFSYRYLILLIVLMGLYFSYYIKTSLQFKTYLPYTWGIAICSILLYNGIVLCQYPGDDSPHYVDGVKLEQKIVNYLEQQNLQKSHIFSTFLLNNAMKDIGSGYLSGQTTFDWATTELDHNTEYIIYTSIEFDSLWYGRSDAFPHFQLVKTFDYGSAQGKLFKRASAWNSIDTNDKGWQSKPEAVKHTDRVAFIRDKIKADTAWMRQIIEKAKKDSLPVDSMITIDALWMMKHPKN